MRDKNVRNLSFVSRTVAMSFPKNTTICDGPATDTRTRLCLKLLRVKKMKSKEADAKEGPRGDVAC